MLQIEAPAKINLSLKILGQREDGFHEIDTLMVPVALCDQLEMEKCAESEVVFTCDEPSLPADGNNLVERAASLYLSRSGMSGGVRINLKKNIPHGAGLGGGSSDAASVLLGMERLFGPRFSSSDISKMAAEIGSDVPFFLMGGPARCTGRGECVNPVPPLPQLDVLLVKPPFGVPTPWAYGQWAATRDTGCVPNARQQFEWGILENDMERPVFSKYILLEELKQWLLERPETEGVLLSGSGSTVFAVLKPDVDREGLTCALTEEFGREFWMCHTHTIAG